MKRVLIISYYWPPTGGSGVQRWVKFAKYLPAEGWQPVIYTPLNPEQLVVDEKLGEEVPPEAEIIRRRIVEPYSFYRFLLGKGSASKGGSDEVNPVNAGDKTFMQRLAMAVRGNFFIPDPRRLWIRPSVRFLKKYLREYPVDVIVSTGPPHSMHLIAQKVTASVGVPWFADFRDPWTKMFYFKHLSLSSWAIRRHQKLEKSVLDGADVVVGVSPLVCDEFREMTATPVELITNGFDEDDFREVRAEVSCEVAPIAGAAEKDGSRKVANAELDVKADFTLTHTGLFAAEGDPILLWDVLAEKCRADKEFDRRLKIRLAGKTDASVLDSIAASRLSEHLTDLGYVSHKDAVREQMGATVLLLPLRKEPEYKAVLPGKVFEYLASGRPILGIGEPEGAMAAVLNSCGGGIVTDWTDKGAVSEYIDGCWEKFKSGEPLVGAKDIDEYSRSRLTKKYVALMEAIIDKK